MGEDISFSDQSQVFCTLEIDIKELLEESRVLNDGIHAMKYYSVCQKPIIEKNRYKIDFAGLVWEVDEFFGENTGLIVAEVELEKEGQSFEKPKWVGDEVTGDPKYYNTSLVTHPYVQW